MGKKQYWIGRFVCRDADGDSQIVVRRFSHDDSCTIYSKVLEPIMNDLKRRGYTVYAIRHEAV